MGDSSCNYAILCCRTLLTRKRWTIALLSIMLISVCFFLPSRIKHKQRFVQVVEITEQPIYEVDNEDGKTLATGNPKQVIQEENEEDSDNTTLRPTCRLPFIDPWHSSVKELIVDLGKLECGTTHSKFENNTLYVEANEALAVSYHTINRPKGNDFEVSLSNSFSISNAIVTQDGMPNQPVTAGKAGCLMHFESKKCLHPFGGEPKPKEGTALVFHSDCCFERIGFKMVEDTSIVHGPSGLCLHVNTENNAVTLRHDCSTKFTVLNGTLHVTGSELCIESDNKLPKNDENVKAGTTCSQVYNLINIKGKAFRASANVDADFVRVDIKRGGGKPDITELHMQTAPKPEVLKRQPKSTGIPVNIALIMFDSTSSANFIRQMTKTNEYLKTRPTVYMKGNTIVGDGTTAQLCAMLTGIAEENEPEARRSKSNAKVVDDWRWVFRDYRDHGYVTFYSEDSPGLATFNYRLKGFRDPPTDHYGRYFWMEAQRHKKSSHCTGSDAMHRITFKYFLSLFRTYREHRKFAFINFSDLTHDNINSVKYADEDLMELLKTMDKENYLDNTIFFIFGDHGIRFGKMRQTLQGKLEERLPHMSVTFPSWFPEKHPKLYEAVKHNSRLLTTPFDIYATLQHVLSYPSAPKGVNVGQSLFYPIDAKKRTCASVGVEGHWCPCMNFEKVPIKEPIVKRLAIFSVKFINKQIEKEGSKVQSLCHRLTLKEIKTASREMPNDKVQSFKNSHANHVCDSCGVVLGKKDENTLTQDTVYQIQFITSPNNGFYEASIQVNKGKPRIKGSISRVDEYGHQPDCIAEVYVHLRKYCYCKTQH